MSDPRRTTGDPRRFTRDALEFGRVASLSDGLFPWLLAGSGWGASTGVTLLALAVAFVLPVGGLAMLLLTWPVEAVVAWRAPSSYRDWG
jgi:hypothetical protein